MDGVKIGNSESEFYEPITVRGSRETNVRIKRKYFNNFWSIAKDLNTKFKPDF